MRGGFPTDPEREAGLGRIPVWLDADEVKLAARTCFCIDRPPGGRHSLRCRYLRKRFDAALDKADLKDE